MSGSEHAGDGRDGLASRAAAERRSARCGARYPAEARALDTLPDCDVVLALRDLPDELRVAVYLADVCGCPYREIAEITGAPVGTVAARLHLGRGRLRDRLALAAAQRGLAPAAG